MSAPFKIVFARSILALAITASLAACGGGSAMPPEQQAAMGGQNEGTGPNEENPDEPTDMGRIPNEASTEQNPNGNGLSPNTEISGQSTADTGDATGGTEEMEPGPSVDLSTPVFCDTDKPRFEEVMLARINAARAEARLCGATNFPAVDRVTWNTKLQTAAEIHSVDMTTHNFFSHTGSDGTEVQNRADTQQYQWRAIGENIAAGQSTAEEVIDGWLNSEGHCRNLMNSAYTEVAVACVSDSNADYKRYWTNVLGAPANINR